MLYGETGIGKSTLINAIIEKEVLPVAGGGDGCTSAIVEVSQNKEDYLYRAEVEFLSKEEWEESIEALLAFCEGWFH